MDDHFLIKRYEKLASEIARFEGIFDNLLNFAGVVEHTRQELNALKDGTRKTFEACMILASKRFSQPVTSSVIRKQIRHKVASNSIRQHFHKHASLDSSILPKDISFLKQIQVPNQSISSRNTTPIVPRRLDSRGSISRSINQRQKHSISFKQPNQFTQPRRHPLAYSTESPIHATSLDSPELQIATDYTQDNVELANLSTYEKVFLNETLIESPKKKHSKKLFRFGWMKKRAG